MSRKFDQRESEVMLETIPSVEWHSTTSDASIISSTSLPFGGVFFPRNPTALLQSVIVAELRWTIGGDNPSCLRTIAPDLPPLQPYCFRGPTCATFHDKSEVRLARIVRPDYEKENHHNLRT